MKTLSITLAAICISLAVPVSIHAQNTIDPREKFSFGMKAGINYSNVWDEQGQDFQADARIGFAGGMFFGIPMGKFLGVQPELLISQKGFQGSGTMFGSPYSYSKTTTYLDIPLQFAIKPTEFFTVLAGPQYSYLLHEKNVYTYGNSSSAQEEEFNNDNIRRNTLGFAAGMDIIIKHVVVAPRMGWDFQANHGDGSSSTPRYKNKWIQLTIGFKI